MPASYLRPVTPTIIILISSPLVQSGAVQDIPFPDYLSSVPEPVMATNLPYPFSDNRSYTAAHSTRNLQDALYGHDDLQYRQGAAYKLSDHQRFYQSSSRTGPSPSQSVLEGIHEGLSVYGPRSQVGETYSGSSGE